MGLGKTLQAISVLSFMQWYHSIDGPHLIIVPVSSPARYRPRRAQSDYLGDNQARAAIFSCIDHVCACTIWWFHCFDEVSSAWFSQKSTLGNWQKEFGRWWPKVRTSSPHIPLTRTAAFTVQLTPPSAVGALL
jgi:hypothetical protein